VKANSPHLHKQEGLAERRLRRAVSVQIALAVGALHFVTGHDYHGPFPQFVNGYLIDILLPFAMVLILGNIEKPWGRSRLLRFIYVFGFGVGVETLQYLGIEVFGSHFDPLDCLMYAIGALAAIVLDYSLYAAHRADSLAPPNF